MKVKHELTMTTVCPVDESVDTYDVEITLHRLVKVEDIAEILASFKDRSIFQENLTQEIAHILAPWSKVRTIGVHSGIRTTCTCVGVSTETVD